MVCFVVCFHYNVDFILLVVMFSASWIINSLIEFTIRIYDLIDTITL